uniref:Putative secreted protein n=1 Tax=Amblyomma cajennense TaxID=34607 RepID=A0A023FE74_AMBCJ
MFIFVVMFFSPHPSCCHLKHTILVETVGFVSVCRDMYNHIGQGVRPCSLRDMHLTLPPSLTLCELLIDGFRLNSAKALWGLPMVVEAGSAVVFTSPATLHSCCVDAVQYVVSCWRLTVSTGWIPSLIAVTLFTSFAAHCTFLKCQKTVGIFS